MPPLVGDWDFGNGVGESGEDTLRESCEMFCKVTTLVVMSPRRKCQRGSRLAYKFFVFCFLFAKTLYVCNTMTKYTKQGDENEYETMKYAKLKKVGQNKHNCPTQVCLSRHSV